MKSNSLILVIPMLLSASVNAVEIYDDTKNSVAVGGRIDMTVGKEKQGDTEINSGSSRINFAFNRNMGNYDFEGLMEWQVNLLSSNDSRGDVLKNRLGYVGLNGDRSGWGTIRAGKQWGAVYDVTSATDVIFISDHDAGGIYQFSDGGATGTGRLDKGLTYQNQWSGFKLGLQYGLKDSFKESRGLSAPGQNDTSVQRDSAIGGSASYEWDNGLKVGAALTKTKMQLDSGSQAFGKTGDFDISSATLMTQYKKHGLHVAATYVQGSNYHMNGFAGGANHADKTQQVLSEKSHAVDAYLAYKLDNNIEPFVYLSTVKMSDNEGKTDSIASIDGRRNMAAAGIKYYLSEDALVGIEYRNIKHQENQRNVGVLKNDEAFNARLRYMF
ncbi:porin [Vibrio mediterranei]|uniref:Porin n=1 Tax=Vibrio mediterranei TaxID=689 RepID=A0A3G4VKW3_9VIBR|nr:porin [Vibrio mediterranei]AYV25015.1 porin [Vibrio mediterranei]MCG9790566.1 porin [Vibrio mediterranei]